MSKSEMFGALFDLRSQVKIPPPFEKAKDGTALYSWRFAIVLSYEDKAGKIRRDLPWTSEDTEEYRVMSWPSYCRRGDLETAVFAVTGKGTAFEEGKEVRVTDLPKNLILVVEVVNSHCHWMQPGDFDVDTMPKVINHDKLASVGSYDNDGFLVGFADGQVWRLNNNIPFKRLETFFRITDATQNSRADLLEEFRTR